MVRKLCVEIAMEKVMVIIEHVLPVQNFDMYHYPDSFLGKIDSPNTNINILTDTFL